MIRAFHDAFPGASDEQHNSIFNTCLAKALRMHGAQTTTSLHSVCYSIDPCTFYDPMRNHGDLCLRNVTDVHEFVQMIIMLKLGVKFCTARVHRALLASGIMPNAVFNVRNTYWVCMLPLSPSVSVHMPIPLTRIMAE